MINILRLKINKYSLFELKTGIDVIIEYYLDFENFEENSKYNTAKIIIVIFTILCAGIAHLFSKQFPDYYNIILFCVIFYVLFRIIYLFIEYKLTNSIFFIGTNSKYCNKLIKKKLKYEIKEIKFYSKIDNNNPSIYLIWFDFIFSENIDIYTSPKRTINCIYVYDERGYLHYERVIHIFKSIFKKEIRKIN